MRKMRKTAGGLASARCFVSTARFLRVRNQPTGNLTQAEPMARRRDVVVAATAQIRNYAMLNSSMLKRAIKQIRGWQAPIWRFRMRRQRRRVLRMAQEQIEYHLEVRRVTRKIMLPKAETPAM